MVAGHFELLLFKLQSTAGVDLILHMPRTSEAP